METKLVEPRGGEATSKDPGELTLERRPDGRVWAVRGGGGAARAVWVQRCFPWSEPGRFLSLRDDDEEEFALVRDPAELDPASRRVLEEALVAAGFVFEVTRVIAIDEEVEIRHWRVETRQGARTFPTRPDDWPRLLPHGGLLARDVARDRCPPRRSRLSSWSASSTASGRRGRSGALPSSTRLRRRTSPSMGFGTAAWSRKPNCGL